MVEHPKQITTYTAYMAYIDVYAAACLFLLSIAVFWVRKNAGQLSQVLTTIAVANTVLPRPRIPNFEATSHNESNTMSSEISVSINSNENIYIDMYTVSNRLQRSSTVLNNI